MGDDLYPNDSGFDLSAMPIERVQEERTEASKVAASYPILDDLIDHLQARIDFYSSIDSIDVDFTENPETHQRLMYAHRVIKNDLTQELNTIRGLKEQYEQ